MVVATRLQVKKPPSAVFGMGEAIGRSGGIGFDADEHCLSVPWRIEGALQLVPKPGAGKALAIPTELHGNGIVKPPDGSPGDIEVVNIEQGGERQ